MTNMRTLSPLFGIMLAVTLPSYAAADQPGARQMIAAADAIRNPQQPFRITNTLTEYVNGAVTNTSTVVIYAKANSDTRRFQNIIRYTAPAQSVGKLLLMSGTSLWFYDSASRTSIRIAPQQRLVGQASNGDVLTVNLAVDYTPTLQGGERIKNGDGQDTDCWTLNLTAATDDAIYHHMTYWLEKDTYRPIKARYYSSSGSVLKIAYFTGYTNYLGAVRPAETVIIDGINPRLVTTIRTSGYAFQAIPDSWFQRDFLPRIPLR